MFKNPFSFEGRIRRSEYGTSFILFAIARVIVTFIAATVMSNDNNSGGVVSLTILLSIPLIWFLFAQGSKRCHDVGWSGWMQLIPFIPLYLIFASGQKGENNYGIDPKENGNKF
jgi:uncharacterized membrane protein YhaH (DUF805 family)